MLRMKNVKTLVSFCQLQRDAKLCLGTEAICSVSAQGGSGPYEGMKNKNMLEEIQNGSIRYHSVQMRLRAYESCVSLQGIVHYARPD